MDRENKERPLCTGLGEILFDCLPGGERLGGAPVNFAYSAKALGLRAAAVSAVGRDERGDRARRLLAEKGIAAHLAETDRETGRVDVSLDTDGVPSYHFSRNRRMDRSPGRKRWPALPKRRISAASGRLPSGARCRGGQCGASSRQ